MILHWLRRDQGVEHKHSLLREGAWKVVKLHALLIKSTNLVSLPSSLAGELELVNFLRCVTVFFNFEH
jgi:hypothetical protein